MPFLEIRCCLNDDCPGVIAGHLEELKADPVTAPIIAILEDLAAELTEILKDVPASPEAGSPGLFQR
jgi:hypothetical protein